VQRPSRGKPPNIKVLRDDPFRRAFGEEFGKKTSLWCGVLHEAKLEERVETWRVAVM
jgi:hypothetical protein